MLKTRSLAGVTKVFNFGYDALVTRTLEVEYDAGVAETINYGEYTGPHALTSIENEANYIYTANNIIVN